MSNSQNGYPVIAPGSTVNDWPRLRTVVIPNCSRTFNLRDGSCAFVLAHYVLYHHEKIRPIDTGVMDDWSYAYRYVRGDSDWSNHSSGTAVDIDATQHPLGRVNTWPGVLRSRILARLRMYRGCIRWGACYSGRKDEMHFEIDRDIASVEKVARRLLDSKRGKAILAANPGLREAVLL